MSIPPEAMEQAMQAMQQQQQQPRGKVGQVAGDVDLAQYVATAKSSVLNSEDPTALAAVLSGRGAVRSDGDEQLLVFVEFTEKVKLREISVEANANDESKEDQSGPANIKIFVNAPHMDFSDAESMAATQELDLKESDLQGGRVPLKFVKFQSVSSLTIFVSSNQGDTDSTFINRLRFYGTTQEGFNMNDLKKSG